MKFDEAFLKVLGHEGGLSMDRKDRGNWTSGVIGKGILSGTKYGISAMAYPHLDIMNLTIEEAKKIYHKDYWIKAKTHKLPKELRYIYFDTAVNQGIGKAIRILQAAAGVEVDGVFGTITEGAAQSVTLAQYALKRLWDYFKIVLRNPLMARYIKGWFNRVYSIVNE